MKTILVTQSITPNLYITNNIVKEKPISLNLYSDTDPPINMLNSWGSSNSQWSAENFTGAGHYQSPFTTPNLQFPSTYWASKQIIMSGYLKIKWDSLSMVHCNYDYFAIGLSNNLNNSVYSYYSSTYSWINCPPQTSTLVIPVSSGQHLVLEPDSAATFTNLKIWWSNMSGKSD
jgi:hypothetical protein